jgi:hypothetical protein
MPGQGVSSRKGLFVWGKQTAFGTPLSRTTGAKQASNIVSGGLKPVRDRSDLSLTSASQARRGQFIQRVRAEGTVTVLATADQVAFWLYSAMGAISTSGAGPNYTHTLTMADNLPFGSTVWSLVADDWWEFSDVVVQTLTIRGESGENIVLEMALLGMGIPRHLGTNAPSPYTVAPDDPRFKYLDSVVKMEADSDTPTVMDNVENVEFVIDRSTELRYGSHINPRQFIPSRDVDFSAGITYEPGMQGWDFLSGSQLGSVAATGDASQNLIKGSFDVTFGKHPSSYAGSMRIYSNGQNWEYMTERPDADPAANPIEMDLAGPVISPDGGVSTEVTAVVVNQTATY